MLLPLSLLSNRKAYRRVGETEMGVVENLGSIPIAPMWRKRLIAVEDTLDLIGS